MSKHQLGLADRQCRMSELSQRLQDAVTILCTALYAARQNDEVVRQAADVVCQDLTRKLTGKRPAIATSARSRSWAKRSPTAASSRSPASMRARS